MLPALQAKLLRFLEEKAFKRVGGSQDLRVNVRVIAATNRDLEKEVKGGRFREDLFYRLNVMPILLPTLRQRAEDIPALIDFYIESFNREFRKRVNGVEPETLDRLVAYAWPGNVRELRNAVERAMLLADGDRLSTGHFPILAHAASSLSEHVDLPAGGINLDRLEESLVQQALDRTNWNLTHASKLLGMNRDQIRYRIEKFGLERAEKTS
jgi:DNA-binding NtrC family response regulator